MRMSHGRWDWIWFEMMFGFKVICSAQILKDFMSSTYPCQSKKRSVFFQMKKTGLLLLTLPRINRLRHLRPCRRRLWSPKQPSPELLRLNLQLSLSLHQAKLETAKLMSCQPRTLRKSPLWSPGRSCRRRRPKKLRRRSHRHQESQAPVSSTRNPQRRNKQRKRNKQRMSRTRARSQSPVSPPMMRASQPRSDQLPLRWKSLQLQHLMLKVLGHGSVRNIATMPRKNGEFGGLTWRRSPATNFWQCRAQGDFIVRASNHVSAYDWRQIDLFIRWIIIDCFFLSSLVILSY